MVNDKKKQINKEIFSVSKYHSLMLAKHTASILTAIYIFIAMIDGSNSIPAFNILIANNLFPVIITYIFSAQNNQKKAEEPTTYVLPRLIKKYRYNPMKYRYNSMSFLLTCLFFILWQYRELKHPLLIHALSFTPFVFLSVIILIRIGGILFFYIHIHNGYQKVNI